MNEVWVRIETSLSTHAPELLEILNKGATTENLELLEHTLGYILPNDRCCCINWKSKVSFQKIAKMLNLQSGLSHLR